ncbi:MAG TPA: LuxR C-terminal-related transcriptional regulator [Stellaceae bacterium]|nr:LuxR C-terminal-related transcriptional regulator [Stellaceae bacterium]
MRILLISGDKRVSDATAAALAGVGIDTLAAEPADDEARWREAAADALVIWAGPLRRMTRRQPHGIAQLQRRMPLIVALALDETNLLADTAHLVNGIVFPEINLRRLGAIIGVARAGYLLLPAEVDRERLRRSSLTGMARRAFTAHENAVLTALARGLTNHQIAQHLAISDSAVKRLVHDALRKLRCENRTQAALYARFDREQ